MIKINQKRIEILLDALQGVIDAARKTLIEKEPVFNPGDRRCDNCEYTKDNYTTSYCYGCIDYSKWEPKEQDELKGLGFIYDDDCCTKEQLAERLRENRAAINAIIRRVNK